MHASQNVKRRGLRPCEQWADQICLWLVGLWEPRLNTIAAYNLCISAADSPHLSATNVSYVPNKLGSLLQLWLTDGESADNLCP